MRKTTILALIFILYSFSVISQGDFGKATPQVADFIRYGQIPVSLFHGHMSLEVPIYHYKDRDFDIPIKLVYTTEGFKPSKRSDLVGLDWTLIAGGCITREIYGAPDDSMPFSEEGVENEYGYYLTVKDGGYNKDKIWDFNSSVVKTSNNTYYLNIKDGFFVDFQPDLFLFNFNGHSGHFMIDDNGTAISTNRGYKIDISNLKEQFLELNYLDMKSSINVITPDGYIYEFGGDESKLEYSISFKDNHFVGNGSGEKVRPTIIAWHLSKITAPNGRVITFNYINNDEDLLADHTNPLWQSSETKTLPNSMFQYGTAIKKSVLKSIKIDGVTIGFNTSKEETLGNNGHFHNHNHYNSAIYQLDSITVKYNNTLKFRYDLSYENRDRRRFLNEVILNDGSKYTFTYEHSNGSYPLPTQGPNGKSDIYGFWKKDNASAGLMKFVYYPTGGYSEFQYEKHQFSKEVRFDAMKNKKYLIEVGNHGNDNTGNNPGSGGNPETETFQDPIHKDSTHMCDGNRVASSSRHNGSRIKKVVHYTADNEKASEKEYIYNTQIEGNTSSGILYQSLPFIGVNIVTGADIYASGSIIWLNNYNIDEPAIGYSNVFERYSDSSYCKYSFYDWNDNPDSLGNDDVKFKFINETTDTIKYNDLSLVLTGHSRVASYSDHRGRLKDKFYYASGSTTSELTEYFDYLNMKRPETDAISDPIQKKHEEPESQREYVVAFLSMEGGGMAKKYI